MKNTQNQIIRQYYVLSCLFDVGGLSIVSAVYVNFLIQNGLNLFEVNLANAVYFATLFVCEIPTGAFADIFGRKLSFVAACGLMGISMFVYGYSSTFFGFACAEIIGAVGSTFKSGAFQAWLVDSLKHHGYEGSCTKIFARERLYRQIGGCFGAVLGSYLAASDSRIPWFVGGIGMGITMVIAYLTIEENYFVRGLFSWKRGWASMRDITITSVRYGMNHKAVRFVLVVTFVQIFAVQSLNMYWQPFFKARGIAEAHYGYLFDAMIIALGIGAFIASRMNSDGKEKSIVLRTQIITGLMIVAAALLPGLPVVLVLFVLHELPRGFWAPMLDGYLQHRIPSSERATISSFCSTAPHIGGVIGLVVSGGIAQLFGISAAWIVSGVVLIIGALLVAKNGYKDSG